MHFETKQIHGERGKKNLYGARNIPIFNTGAFLLESNDSSGKNKNYIYTRNANPTVEEFEEEITALECGEESVAFSSGMAAIFCALITLLSPGDELIVSKQLNGGVYNLLEKLITKFNITIRYFDADDTAELKMLINKNTKAVYFDSIGNPMGNIPDFESIINISHQHYIPVVIDNTVPSPYLFNPITHGADVVIHSTAKFICSNSSTMGGIVTSSKNFICRDNNHRRFIENLRKITAPYVGACLTPFSAYTLICGTETLSTRVKAQSSSTQIIAEFLNNHPRIDKVFYAGLKDNKYNSLAKKYFPRGLPSVFSITLRAGNEECLHFLNSLHLFNHQVNFGDVRSLIMQPSQSLYTEIPTQWKQEFQFDQRYFRVSIGLENVDDLIDDLSQALEF